MSLPARCFVLLATGLFLFLQVGCNVVPYPTMRQAQIRSYQLYNENLVLEQRNGELEQQLAQSQSDLHKFQQRLENMRSGLVELKKQNVGLLDRLKNSRSPLAGGSSQRLRDLAGKFKNFEFDPETGVSKFHSDVLFDIGSAQLKPEGRQLLHEFAQIMNEGNAKQLNILVVGHTDDRRIAHASTRSQHPTNWHLSTNRANSVVLALSKCGIDERRLGAAGYSMNQPVVPNSNDSNRSLNRRVEIYVLTPDAAVAGRWNDRGLRRR